MTPNEHDKPETPVEHETTDFYPFSTGRSLASREAHGQPQDWMPDWQRPGRQPEGPAVEEVAETAPDLPVMEQLPGMSTLPDPGYPEMPASTPPPARLPPQLFPPPQTVPPLESSAQPAPPPLPELTFPEPPPVPPPPVPEPPLPEPPLPELSPLEPLPPPETPASLEFDSGRVKLSPLHDPTARDPDPDPDPASPRVSRASQEPQESEQPWTYQSTQRSVNPRSAWTPDPYVAPRTPGEAPPLPGPAVPWSQVRTGTGRHARDEPLAAPPAVPKPGLRDPAGLELAVRELAVRELAVREPAAGGSGTAAGGLSPRHSADALTSDVLLPGKRATPDGGWRRTVYRASGGLIRVGESAASVHRRDLVDRVRAPLAGGHHRVAVLSLKGGVGKTTVTVGLGSTLASLRGDRVVAVDGNPDRGTLSDKVRLQTSSTIRDLLAQRGQIRRYADIRTFTSQAPSRLEILASDRDPGVSVAFSADDYRSVIGLLEHFYSICITDCGTGLLHSAMAGILELADQIVLVSSPSVDGARSASATLDWLDAHHYGDLVAGGVVVLSAIRRKSKSTVDLNRLEQHFAARCRAVVRVPYDPHLEEGAEVDLEMLNEDTADAYLTLGALVADRFVQPRSYVSGAAPGSPLA